MVIPFHIVIVVLRSSDLCAGEGFQVALVFERILNSVLHALLETPLLF